VHNEENKCQPDLLATHFAKRDRRQEGRTAGTARNNEQSGSCAEDVAKSKERFLVSPTGVVKPTRLQPKHSKRTSDNPPTPSKRPKREATYVEDHL
jgi:hypothetical protein